MMFPLFTNKEFILLIGEEGVGKSMVALDFSLMIAAGKSKKGPTLC